MLAIVNVLAELFEDFIVLVSAGELDPAHGLWRYLRLDDILSDELASQFHFAGIKLLCGVERPLGLLTAY